MSHIATRNEYGTSRRRFAFSADRTTESRILDAQKRLSEITGVQPSVSAAIAYLVKQGHEASTAESTHSH